MGIFVEGSLVCDPRVGKNGPAGDLKGDLDSRLPGGLIGQLAPYNGFHFVCWSESSRLDGSMPGLMDGRG